MNGGGGSFQSSVIVVRWGENPVCKKTGLQLSFRELHRDLWDH